jgi:hypothetical protein
VTNPNNCATCDHKRHPDGGHCYMFRRAPQVACLQHTARDRFSMSMFASSAALIAALHAATLIDPDREETP